MESSNTPDPNDATNNMSSKDNASVAAIRSSEGETEQGDEASPLLTNEESIRTSNHPSQAESSSSLQSQVNTTANINSLQNKVKVHFIPVGSAPIMKRNRFVVNRNEMFASLQMKLRKLLQLDATESTAITSNNFSSPGSPSPPLFMYVHSSFIPSPEENMGEIYDLFYSPPGELKVYYCLQEAWG